MLKFEEVKEKVDSKLKEDGYTLCEFNYHKGKPNILEVVVDKDTPINLDDITSVSNKISDLLDEFDFTNDSYTLDVSSLGVEKPIDITKLDKYLNEYINVHVVNPFKGLSYLEGTLIEINDNEAVLSFFIKGKPTKARLNRKDIDKARLAIKF